MQASKLFAIASFFIGISAAVPALAASSMESRSWGTVVWEDRAGACGNAAGVSNLVEHGLGAHVANDPLFVRAEVERARVGRTRASIFMRRGSAIAVRDLDAGSCEELTRASAVVIAMAYELGLDPQPPAPPAAEPAPVESAAVVEPAPVAPLPPAAERAQQPAKIVFVSRGALTLAPIADVGTLPGLSGGVRARVARDFGPIGAALYGTYLPNVERNMNGVDVDLGYVAASVRLFRSFGYRNWSFDVSMGIALGQYFVDGGDVELQRAGKPPFTAFESSLEGAYRLTSSVRLRTTLEYALHIQRPAFSAEHRSVWDPSGAALRASIGPELLF
jgi:hypothetical protein